ncbi:hypothetical protein GCM10022630_17100 [Thermobifida alba]
MSCPFPASVAFAHEGETALGDGPRAATGDGGVRTAAEPADGDCGVNRSSCEDTQTRRAGGTVLAAAAVVGARAVRRKRGEGGPSGGGRPCSRPRRPRTCGGPVARDGAGVPERFGFREQRHFGPFQAVVWPAGNAGITKLAERRGTR